MDSLVSGVGFLQNEVNLLENMKERGIGVEECSWIWPSGSENGIVRIYTPSVDSWIEVSIEDGSCEYT